MNDKATKGRGRPSAWRLSKEEAKALRGLVLMRSTENRIRFTVALEEFINHPACLPGTRDKIIEELEQAQKEGRLPRWSQSLRRMGYPNDAEMSMFRGPKHMANAAPSIRRGGYWIDEKGNERELRAMNIWESDDVSINEPFRWMDEQTGLWMAGRQTLATIDVGSGGWLGATCIGRPRDAYRQEDIADHMRDLCELWGMPDVWRLEKGSWEATFVGGIEVEGLATRWGSLDKLFRVVHTEHARGKGLIEGRFDLLQTFMAHTEGGLTMGRKPDDFEKVAKLLRRANYDRRRAENELTTDQKAVQKLWSINDASMGVRRAMERCNARPMQRSWASDQTPPCEFLKDAKGHPIPESEKWRFCGCKTMATVREGHIQIKLPNYEVPFRFAINGVDSFYLPQGYQLFVAFSPSSPFEGAYIGNRERGVRNRDSWGLGEIIPFMAQYVPAAPQVDLTTQSGASGPGLRKGMAACVRAEFRGIRTSMREYIKVRKEAILEEEPELSRSEHRDGLGNRTEISRGLRKQKQPLKTRDLSGFRGRSLGDDEEETQSSDTLTRFRNQSLHEREEPECGNECARTSLRERANELMGESYEYDC
ncbi:MAG: hypothetical protein JW739_05770 [Opitutales bacterium]|nr:hypothetical protein [Opitutales bacterium]